MALQHDGVIAPGSPRAHADRDCWIFGDTLEHLKDAWAVCARSVASCLVAVRPRIFNEPHRGKFLPIIEQIALTLVCLMPKRSPLHERGLKGVPGGSG